MVNELSRFGGHLLMLDAVIHTAVGLGLYAGALGGIAQDGVVNAVHPYTNREAAWWFFVTGLLYLTIGLFARWAQRQGIGLPGSLGATLVGLALVGLVLVPSIGWLFIAAAGALMLLGRQPTGSRKMLGADGLLRRVRGE